MSANQRIALAIGTFLLLGVLAALGWSYHSRQAAPGQAAGALAVNVTSPDDLGPGTLREALFVVAAAKGKANVLIKTQRITLKTALPPLMNLHGVRIVGEQPGVEIDAQALAGGPVFDVIGANTSLEGLVVRNCPAAAILLRAAHFHMQSSTIESCDVGVDVAENASDILLEHNRFTNDRVGVRFTAPNPDTIVAGNSFLQNKVAGLWAVRGDSGAARGGVHGITLRESLSDPRQWALNISWLLIGGIAIMISVHAVPYARDQGVSLTGASLSLTAYGIGSAIGRLLGGMLSDRMGARRTIAAAFVLQIVALVGLLWLPSRAALLLSLMAFGAGFAASDTVVAQVVPQVFGMRALGAIMGILTLGWRCGAAIGPALAGFLYDLTGSYRIPFGLAPLGVLLSWALFLLATARGGRARPRAAAT